jgi:hypothetical protein
MTKDRTLSLTTVNHVMNVPIEKVNIADWLLNLPDAEYQRCSPAHIACGTTTSDNGEPMSINVETIGDTLVIQHYVAEVHERLICRMVSISDGITAKGRTKVKVVWELSAKAIDAETSEYTNHIHATATDDFMQFIEKNGVPFESAHAARQEASHLHNLQETPNFAKSIERKALKKS